MNKTVKFKVTRIFCIISAVCLLFWWPLSHLFYSDWYHQLLGFELGSYQKPMVIVIGVCGFLPVMNLVIISLNPIKYKALAVVMIIFCFLLIAMYTYLIMAGIFPFLEIINIGICFIVSLILIFIYP